MRKSRSTVVAAALLTLVATAAAHGRHDPDEHGNVHVHRASAAAAAAAPAVAPTVERRVRTGAGDFTYESVAGWCRLPDDRPLGNTHGAIVIDARGGVYYNTDTARSIMVHRPDGRFARTFGSRFPGIHGMALHVENGKEYIYAAHLFGKQLVKLASDGTVAWTLDVAALSGKYDDDPKAFNPTGIAVAPNGHIYVADGYGRNWIHQIAPDRTHVRSFGGRGNDDGRFVTCHGIAIDPRGEDPVLLVCDRENRRLQRFALDGTFIDVAATDLRRPCGVAFHGDVVAVAELEGRVTLLDRDFKVLAHLGDNPDRGQWANNGVPQDKWTEGVFTAPHAVAFDREGSLYVMDWNAAGRISKLVRVAGDATDDGS